MGIKTRVLGLAVVVAALAPTAWAAAPNGSPPPINRQLEAIIESAAAPQSAAIAQQLRVLNRFWRIYGQDIDKWRTGWCSRDVVAFTTRMINRLWRADTRALPVLTQLALYLRSGCLSSSSVDYWTNYTADRFNRLVQRELLRQERVGATSWTKPTPKVPSSQKPLFTNVAKFTCTAANTYASAWLARRYAANASPLILLAGMAGGFAICDTVIEDALTRIIG